MQDSVAHKVRIWCEVGGFPFRANLLLFSTSLSLAILFQVFRQPVPRLVLAMALTVSAGVIWVPLAEYIASIPAQVRSNKKLRDAKPAYSFALIAEMDELASRLGMKPVDDYRLVRSASGWLNAACAPNGCIVFGQPIIEEFDWRDRQGIICHELAHQKARHLRKRALLFTAALPLFFYVALLPFPFYFNGLLLFAAWGLVMPLISWPFEYQADAIAAKHVGKDAVIGALKRLAGAARIDVRRDSYTHPSIARRIARLERVGAR